MFFGTAALFSCALLLGGLGPHAPLLNGLIEAAAFPLLIAVSLFGLSRVAGRRDCAVATLLLLLLLLVGVAQLAPLPTSIWRTLPGRDVSVMVLETLGTADRPRPISLAPETTRLVLQSWLPPIAIFVAAMLATRAERIGLARLVVAAAAISSVFGLLQLAAGDGSFFLDPGGISNRYPGLFANPNHQAVFLATAVALLPALRDADGSRRGASAWWPAAFWGLALIGTLITASRAGLALFVASSVIAAARLVDLRSLTGRAFGRERRRTIVPAMSAVVVLALVGWLASGGYRAELMSARYGEAASDVRYEFWTTSLAAALSVFPYGAGFGTFETAYQLVEPLETVHNYVVNHAHNDYLEIVIEAGAAGILLVAVFALWYASRLVALVRRDDLRDPLAWSGATIVALVLIHSLVDYPLRTEAIGCTFAFACALLLAPPGDTRTPLRVRTVPAEEIAA